MAETGAEALSCTPFEKAKISPEEAVSHWDHRTHCGVSLSLAKLRKLANEQREKIPSNEDAP
jgi:hypothetical protein